MASVSNSVGAFVVPRKMLNGLRLALRECQWLKAGINITPFAGHPIPSDAVEPYAALHVSPLCAEAMNSHDSVTLQGWTESDSQLFIPAEVRPFLQSSKAYWVPGLRVGSPACAKPPQPQSANLRKRKQPNTYGSNSKDSTGQATNNLSKRPEKESVGSISADANLDSAPSPAAFTFTELFAGVGGFRVALEQLGGQSVFTSEIDVEARAVLARSFTHDTLGAGGVASPLLCGDITEVEDNGVPYDHDLLTGGFPCQSFSSMGRQDGFDDARGLLFLEVVRLLRASQPKAFLLENVANLAFLDGGKSLARIVAELESTGYHVLTRLINSRVVLPQQRLRVYLVGFRRNYVIPPNASRVPASVTSAAAAAAPGATAPLDRFAWPELPLLETSVSDVLEDEASGVDTDPAYMLTPQQFAKLQTNVDWCADPARRLVALNGPARTLMSSYRKGWAIRSEFVWRQPLKGATVPPAAAASDQEGASETTDDCAVNPCNMKSFFPADIGSSNGERSKEISSSRSGPPRPRFYTVSECCALQGFPRTFASTLEDKRATQKPLKKQKQKGESSHGAAAAAAAGATSASPPHQPHEQRRGADGRSYHQIGNAVSPPVVCAIAASILAALGIAPGAPRGLHPSPPLLSSAVVAASDEKEHDASCACSDTSMSSNKKRPLSKDQKHAQEERMKGDHNGSSNLDTPEAARQRRQVVAPALELLLSAYPRPGATRELTSSPLSRITSNSNGVDTLGRESVSNEMNETTSDPSSLQELCQSFLKGDLKGPSGCTGRLSSLADARTGTSDVATVRRLLRSKQAAARVSGLASIGRAVHLERDHSGAVHENGSENNSSSGSISAPGSNNSGKVGSEVSLSCKAVLDGGLLPLICACLPPAMEAADINAAPSCFEGIEVPIVTSAAAVNPAAPVSSEANACTPVVAPGWMYSAAERCMTTEDWKEVPHLALVALAVMSRQPNKPLKGRLDAGTVLALRAAVARGGRSGPAAADVLLNAEL